MRNCVLLNREAEDLAPPVASGSLTVQYYLSRFDGSGLPILSPTHFVRSGAPFFRHLSVHRSSSSFQFSISPLLWSLVLTRWITAYWRLRGQRLGRRSRGRCWSSWRVWWPDPAPAWRISLTTSASLTPPPGAPGSTTAARRRCSPIFWVFHVKFSSMALWMCLACMRSCCSDSIMVLLASISAFCAYFNHSSVSVEFLLWNWTLVFCSMH